MPDYLHYLKTDWGYAALTPGEQAIARRFEALLRAAPGVTTDWLAGQMVAASRLLPGRTLRARGEDDEGEFALVAIDGLHGDDPDPADYADEVDITGLLTADDYRAAGVTQIWTLLLWSPPLLDAMVARAEELDVSLSWIVQSSWKLAGHRVAEADLGAYPIERPRIQSVFLLVDQWAELTDRAAAEDRSKSWLVQRAVALALPALARV